jgi:hypothetical protein
MIEVICIDMLTNQTVTRYSYFTVKPAPAKSNAPPSL